VAGLTPESRYWEPQPMNIIRGTSSRNTISADRGRSLPFGHLRSPISKPPWSPYKASHHPRTKLHTNRSPEAPPCVRPPCGSR